MSAERTYAVDRVEGQQVLLVDDDGTTVVAHTRRLPPGIREGAILQVEVDAAGNPRWDTARLDAAEAARRKAEAKELLERLKKRDPGGDVAL